jgi:hypothetical protein
MIKPPLTGLAVVLLSACGGATSPDPQAMGTAYFKMDQVSCAYSGAKSVTFYIATVDVGTQSLAGGATSTGYLTKPSATYATPARGPVVQARIANYTATGGALWTLRTNINIPSNGTVTHTFVC